MNIVKKKEKHSTADSPECTSENRRSRGEREKNLVQKFIFRVHKHVAGVDWVVGREYSTGVHDRSHFAAAHEKKKIAREKNEENG